MPDHDTDPCVPTPSDRTATIRRLNDTFRNSGAGGIVAVTPGIKALGELALGMIINAIRFHADFTEDNDPYSEHDMGTLNRNGERIFWKIDYYDTDVCFGSPDPADPTLTTRILTIMLAAEY